MARRGFKRRRSKPPAKIHSLQSFLPTKGQYHDLLAIYNIVNRKYFNGKIRGIIRWRRKPYFPQRHNKTMWMGICYFETGLISIHQALDRSWIPRFFVEYVIFHEMLHIKYPPKKKRGSNHLDLHHKEFLAAEKKFPNYNKAQRWEAKNIDQLLFF